jgi:hypothetical protein
VPSAPLEYIGAGHQAGQIAKVIENIESVRVPTNVLGEVPQII